MVAIALAIAAVAYAYFTGMIGGGEETIPSMQLNRDEQTDRLIVTTADEEADWSRIYIYLKDDPGGTTIYFNYSADADTASSEPMGVGAGGADRVLYTTTRMVAGSYLDFAASATIQEVTIVVKDGPANAIIGEYIFQEIGTV